MLRRLTDTFVDRLKPEAGVLRVWDVEVKGFGLRVTPTGHKSYIFQFTRGKAKVQATIGGAASWSCEAARDKARQLRRLHEDGSDARATLVAGRSGRTLEDLADCWREDDKPKNRPHSQAVYESLLKRILAELGNRLVKDLSLEDVEALHRKVVKEGHGVTANRVVSLLRRLLFIAGRKGWWPLGSNPAVRVEHAPEEPRDRVLSAGELKALGASLRTFPARGLDPDPIRFLARSGLRKNEALGLRWGDLDLQRGTMTFRVHKTSKKAGVKVLPINSNLREILDRRAAEKLSPFVFPGSYKRVVQAKEGGGSRVIRAFPDGPLTKLERPWALAVQEARQALVFQWLDVHLRIHHSVSDEFDPPPGPQGARTSAHGRKRPDRRSGYSAGSSPRNRCRIAGPAGPIVPAGPAARIRRDPRPPGWLPRSPGRCASRPGPSRC